MRGSRYPPTEDGLRELFSDCKRTTDEQDDDDLIVISGDTGAGKSTVALLFGVALDPAFGVERVIFEIEAWMRAASHTPAGGVLVCDEFLASARKAMHGEMIDLNDFLQICRGLNLHLIVCYPDEETMDKPILKRARWWIYVEKFVDRFGVERRRFIVHKRTKRRLWQKDGTWKNVYRYPEVGRWRFGPNEGPLVDAYLVKKKWHMRKKGVDEEAQPEAPSASLDAGFDWARLDRGLVGLAKRARASRDVTDASSSTPAQAS